MLNASLESILGGHKPKISQVIDDREYFQFSNGQVRRQIGHGHSRSERRARRLARQISKRWEFPTRGSRTGDMAAGMLEREHVLRMHRRNVVGVEISEVETGREA